MSRSDFIIIISSYKCPVKNSEHLTISSAIMNSVQTFFGETLMTFHSGSVEFSRCGSDFQKNLSTFF